MNEPEELSLSAVNRKRNQEGDTGTTSATDTPDARSNSEVRSHPADSPVAPIEPSPTGGMLEALPFDPVRLLAAIMRGWGKILVAGGVTPTTLPPCRLFGAR
jgi:hypothetical protein